MTCSPARFAANRRNAALSTGPRTPEGKARSRANARKHGLTGDGVALPIEDAAEVERRFEGFAAELRPTGEVGAFLVRRAALFSIRLERCAREETARLTLRVDHAEAAFDEARLAEVERLMADLATNPAGNARRLRQTPEGVDRLIAAFLAIKGDLYHPTQAIWTSDHRLRVLNLMGLRPDDFPLSRVTMLSEAIDGRFDWLEPHEGAGLDAQQRGFWAMMAMDDLIDAEVAELTRLRESLDLDAIDRDRAGAADRALFDTSPGAVLARKYEAAAERSFHRALSDLEKVEKAAQEPQAGESTGRGHLASFFPATEPVEAAPERPEHPGKARATGPLMALVGGSDSVVEDGEGGNRTS